ncbi:MAG: hypothetical protein ACLTLY_03925 [Agathobacter rectalis]
MAKIKKRKGGTHIWICVTMEHWCSPSSYAVMDEEEMSYMEGGIRVSKYSSGKVFDTYRVHFTAAECSK